MRQYELTYLISDNVEESEITKVTGQVGGLIADESGKVLHEESWGRRKLAYPIRKELFATYITVNFELEPEKLAGLERDIKHQSEIVRYLLLVKDFGKEKLSLTEKDITGTEEIKKAVGGEKSFEAVEGEKAESKDLMAVRGEKEEAETEDARSPSTPLGTSKKQDTNKSQISESEIEKDKIEERPAKVEEAKPEKVEKPVKKVAKKVKKATEVKPEAKAKPEAKPKIEVKKTEIVEKLKKPKKEEATDEADRLAKLDEELDEILGEKL